MRVLLNWNMEYGPHTTSINAIDLTMRLNAISRLNTLFTMRKLSPPPSPLLIQCIPDLISELTHPTRSAGGTSLARLIAANVGSRNTPVDIDHS